LIAALQQRSGYRKQFDPNQPRDSCGRWCLGLGSQRLYSPDRSRFHEYIISHNLVCRPELRCSETEAKDQLLRFAFPGQDPGEPVMDNGTYGVKFPDTDISVGKIIASISPDGLLVQNVTKEGHIF